MTLAFAATAGAQEPRSLRSTLDSIARLALARNLGVLRAAESAREADAGVREARGRLLPTLGIEARHTEASGAIDLGDLINPAYRTLNQLTQSNSFPTDVSVTLPLRQESKLRSVVPLFNGALYANVAGARATRELRGGELGAAIRRLDAESRTAWLDWARAARAIEIWDATIAVITENVRVSQRCVEAGTATPDAVLRARASLADAQQQRLEALRMRDAARGVVNLTLDQPDATPLPLPANEDVPGAPEITLPEALTASAKREERHMAKASIDGARAQGRAASSAFLPSVGVAVDYGVQGDRYAFDREHDVATASLVLSWNLFNGGADRARREAATAASRGAGLRATEIDRQIELDVRTAWDAVHTARSAVEAATARLAAAQSAFTLVERRFAEGLASHLEWSDARAQLTAAQLNHLMTRYLLAARGIDLERAAALRDLPSK
jgi:outer membrane protein TolC